MKIIKLNAIDSTNSFLKELTVNSSLESFTVVIAKDQTKGRGQMKSSWFTEPHKNLTFSVFIRFSSLLFKNNKYLSFAVSLSVYESLVQYSIPKFTIKWPNDIMSVNNKLGGVLIENVLKKDKIATTVIGIGLNVNQETFSNELVKATSLKNILKEELNLEKLLFKILEKLKMNIELLENENFEFLEKKYLNVLYKKDIPSMYRTAEGNLFMGKIIGVSQEGKLQLELEDQTVKEFNLKEVSFV